jgi:hypothetical protein
MSAIQQGARTGTERPIDGLAMRAYRVAKASADASSPPKLAHMIWLLYATRSNMFVVDAVDRILALDRKPTLSEFAAIHRDCVQASEPLSDTRLAPSEQSDTAARASKIAEDAFAGLSRTLANLKSR